MIEFLKNNWKDLLLIILVILATSFIMSTSCTKQKLDIAENNISALTDTISTYKLKNGELLYEKQGYIAEKEQLSTFIGVQESEIKELEKKLGSAISTIAKLKQEVKVDTLKLTDSVYVYDDEIRNDFSFSDNWLSLSGTTIYKDYKFSTTLNNLSMDVPLKVGTTKDNTWFVTSENPYVSFSSIEGASIEKAKPKRFSLTVHVGLGLSYGYGLSGSIDGIVRNGWFFGPAVHIGAGVSYKLFEF
jgi:hypothetical protein